MDLTAVPKFEPDVFTDTELADLNVLAGLCEAASSDDEIEAAGLALDEWRERVRERAKRERDRARSRNALFKRLAQEVPRRFGKAVNREK
jgi:hypothetical protein